MALQFSKKELRFLVAFHENELGKSIDAKLPEFEYAISYLMFSDKESDSKVLWDESVEAVRKMGKKL